MLVPIPNLAPFQGDSVFLGVFPGLKPWAESSCPFGASLACISHKARNLPFGLFCSFLNRISSRDGGMRFFRQAQSFIQSRKEKIFSPHDALVDTELFAFVINAMLEYS